MKASSAGAVIIGDEILSGKFADANTPALIDMLADIGVRLGRVVVIGDDEREIAAEVRAAAQRFDAVITSGGLGPTHDDRTVAAVSAAFGRPVVRDPSLERFLRKRMGARFTEAALAMADVPEGARLVEGDDRLLPTIAIENVYLLPGVPRLFRVKLETLRRELRGARPVAGRVFLTSFETDVADRLTRAAARHPAVRIGSYPRPSSDGYRLLVTVESEVAEPVLEALETLLADLPGDCVVRIERPDA